MPDKDSTESITAINDRLLAAQTAQMEYWFSYNTPPQREKK